MTHKYRLVPLLTVIILALALGAAPAFAPGYNSDSSITTSQPHGGYVTTSNKCKSCHAVHVSEQEYKLRWPAAASASTACDYCHGQTGIVVNKKIWLNSYGHGTSETGDIVVPDDTTYTSYRNDVWTCVACHSPHGAKVVTLSEEPSITTSMLLRKFPNPEKPAGNAYYTGAAGTLTLTAWCSNCHEANFGSHTEGKSTPVGTRYGHDSSTTGYQMADSTWAVVAPNDTTNTGPTCRQCHTADPAPVGMSKGFPHASDSWSMLKASSTTGTTTGPIEAGKLDKLCASSPCHKTTDLP